MSLSHLENTLLTSMRNVGLDVDIPIANMWVWLTGDYATDENRDMQQYVGAFVSRINNKQDEFEIKPGELKRTYRVQLKQKNT